MSGRLMNNTTLPVYSDNTCQVAISYTECRTEY